MEVDIIPSREHRVVSPEMRDGRDSYGLLPRARLRDVIAGRAPLVGARVVTDAPRGWVSPVEARVYLGIPYGDLAAEETHQLARLSWRSRLGIVLRAGIARALTPRRGLRYERRPFIVSSHVDNITIDEALAALMEAPGGHRARLIFIVHPHALNLARFRKDFAELLTRGDLVLPDGVGIRIAASLLGVSMRHNINGTDLLPLICVRAAAERVPLVLIGGADGVARQCADNLQNHTPGLKIAFVHHGYLDPQKSREVAAHVMALGRCLVLVGMGSPLQERWAWEYLRDAKDATVVTVGGLFDFFSGRIPRAPVAWREMGIEWLWRLRMEPRRLAKRYLIGNPLFLLLTLHQRLRGTTGPTR
ncbi:MAG TPA: WecB/TagA/CpsF family glycosyltransferase [Bacteroidota bacterium]|nr:WecB/TagA/CpsF family glycosyltransferase [Bacteroidota bacterium]